MKKYPFHIQHDRMDCGPTCLRIVAETFGKSYSLDELRDMCYLSKEGVSLFNLAEAAEKIGFRTLMVQLEYDKLIENCPLPCILHWNHEHFVVLHKKINKSNWFRHFFSKDDQDKFLVADPAHGLVKVDRETIQKSWATGTDQKGIALVLYPTEEFYADSSNPKKESKSRSFNFLYKYVKRYKRYVFELTLGMVLGSIISLIFPFLTQVLVDSAIGNGDVNLVMLVLLGQLLLFAGQIMIDLIRNWILLHVTTRVSISIISDFLMKLMQLPIKFFDIKSKGDITQRIQDHHRVEDFLTGATLNTVFSTINIAVFTVILFLYSPVIFGVFLALSLISIGWILYFLERRKHLDYKRFQSHRDNQNNIFEIIEGMQEIKLNNAELSKRWSWEKIQVKLFKLRIKTLSLDQYQVTGFTFINQFKNIMIMYIAATEAISGSMTVGMMLSISYILGQSNGPLQQLVSFFRMAQDAKISLERLQEIHQEKDKEEKSESSKEVNPGVLGEENKVVKALNGLSGDITLQNVSFKYGGPQSPQVLQGIKLKIPKGKITAVVGASGSGKTTLLKLLLNFYPPQIGTVKIGMHDLNHISEKQWRNQCGVVMQNGYIFSDTIAANIAVDGKEIDQERLKKAVQIANLDEFIERLPLGINTKIGEYGNGISGGQQQRILIARAVYKNPDYLFFDEATSSLDANNEKVIMEKLNGFFENRTVVIIAHRLSTVKNADQIIVLDNGKIEEIGTHEELTREKGKYFNLVKNQLELGV